MALLNQGVDWCYDIGGITIQVQADLPITEETFQPTLQKFRIVSPRIDLIHLTHHFTLPEIKPPFPGRAIYNRPPWAVYHQQDDSWVYLGIATKPKDTSLHRVVCFNADHTRAEIYNPNETAFRKGNLEALTLFPTDQILLARLLADRDGALLHSAGMILGGQGLLFAGHSGAGKSTIVRQIRKEGEILCDDRNIIRRHAEGWRLYGTWSHGVVPDVSPASAPLRAILLLEQSPENRLIPIDDPREIVRRLPFFIIKPLVTADWWEKTLDLVGAIAREVPVYRLQFDRSGHVVDVLRELL